jgi:tetrapyrrole methylase family protein/MazG family protein
MVTKNSFKKEKYSVEDLRDIVKILRAPGGCPWDAEQSHKSIRRDLLEEAYEVADAIDTDDEVALCEELGDLLLQVVFHSQIATEEESFTLDEVADGICKKLILRHPHVFGNVKAETSEEVLNNWDAIKRDEKEQKTFSDTLKSVPRAFPALMRAAKVQKRAAKAGFDWDNAEDAFKKLPEETEEFRQAVALRDREKMEEEFGDLLFAAVNVSRFYKIDAEAALASATDKFMKRFELVENEVLKSGHQMTDLSLNELDAIWNEVKHKK